MARQRHVQPAFMRGINRRFPVDRSDDPQRLYTLQNARLIKRGESGYVSRIRGFQTLPFANDGKYGRVLGNTAIQGRVPAPEECDLQIDDVETSQEPVPPGFISCAGQEPLVDFPDPDNWEPLGHTTTFDIKNDKCDQLWWKLRNSEGGFACGPYDDRCVIVVNRNRAGSRIRDEDGNLATEPGELGTAPRLLSYKPVQGKDRISVYARIEYGGRIPTSLSRTLFVGGLDDQGRFNGYTFRLRPTPWVSHTYFIEYWENGEVDMVMPDSDAWRHSMSTQRGGLWFNNGHDPPPPSRVVGPTGHNNFRLDVEKALDENNNEKAYVGIMAWEQHGGEARWLEADPYINWMSTLVASPTAGSWFPWVQNLDTIHAGICGINQQPGDNLLNTMLDDEGNRHFVHPDESLPGALRRNRGFAVLNAMAWEPEESIVTKI